MKVRKYVLGFLLAASAAVAFAAASPTRLSDFVLVGNGVNTLKWLSFDVGLGAGNPMIRSTSIGTLGLSTNGTNFMVVPAATDTFVGINTADALQNKNLNDSNTVRLTDTKFKLEQTGGVTTTAQFGLNGLSASRIYTLPDANGSFAFSDVSQTFTNTQQFASAGSSHVVMNDPGGRGGNVPHSASLQTRLETGTTDVYICCDGSHSATPLTCSGITTTVATGGGCNSYNIYPLFSTQPIIASSIARGWHCETDGATDITVYVMCMSY